MRGSLRLFNVQQHNRFPDRKDEKIPGFALLVQFSLSFYSTGECVKMSTVLSVLKLGQPIANQQRRDDEMGGAGPIMLVSLILA